ncbi:LOW QUALITY PROTEIN: hypothetical protein TorRG33x02_159670 [Trema orientale]|uniref:Uncharacterized protein n=1 Tax=Trema orientale TaxID=63057 RepID=A0A2P5ERG6_TREOI|nr:LOW QUALITY PROTEIN: hypothetical protein TorRG33x02_159670 [Trema orientale]
MARTQKKRKKKTGDSDFEYPHLQAPLLRMSTRLKKMKMVVESSESSPILISTPVAAKTTWKKQKFAMVKH